MMGTIRAAVAVLLVCSQCLATAQTNNTANVTRNVSDTEPVLAAAPSNATDPEHIPLPPTKKKAVRGFNKRARGHGLDGGQPASKGSKGSFRTRTGGIRQSMMIGASPKSGSKQGSKGKAGGPKSKGTAASSDEEQENAEDERSSIEARCEASVANATLVTTTDRSSKAATYRMELYVIASTSEAASMRYTLRSALQRQVAPYLASCHGGGSTSQPPTNATTRRVRHLRQPRRILLAGVLNVVFGPLQVNDIRTYADTSWCAGQHHSVPYLVRSQNTFSFWTAHTFVRSLLGCDSFPGECPDPSGAHGQASCLRAVGNVSVYRQEQQASPTDGDSSRANSSVSMREENDNEFAVALSNRTQGDGALQGVPGLLDVFSCTVTPIRNATSPVPEGSGRTNETQTNAPEPDNSQRDRSAATSPSGMSATAGVMIAIAVMVVLLLAVLLLVRQRRRRRQERIRPFAAVKDEGDNTSTGYDSVDDYGPLPAGAGAAGSMKILGPARDDRTDGVALDPPTGNGRDAGRDEKRSSRGVDHNDSQHEDPTVEERVIDHEEDNTTNAEEGGPSDDDTRDVEIIPVFRLLTAVEINPPEDEQSYMSVVRERRNYE
jgi:hypothetical protein